MRVSVLACVALVALAGCSSSPSPSGSSRGPSSSGAAPSASHHDHSAKTVEVALQGNKFVNDTVTLYVGDTIQWTNKDMVGHSVTSDAGSTGSFDNKPNCAVALLPSPLCMANGEKFSYTFEAAGKTTYHCRAHANMVGTVTVMEHPAS
jgi:plastocyanin